MTAAQLIHDMAVRFAHRHEGRYEPSLSDTFVSSVTFPRAAAALAFAGGLHELGCTVHVDLLQQRECRVEYALPLGA